MPPLSDVTGAGDEVLGFEACSRDTARECRMMLTGIG
jgi:hypothetical protein